MGRTVQEIYDSIITEKQTQTVLNGLVPNPDDAQTFLDAITSASKVAIWRLWAFIIAVAMFVHEGLWDSAKAEIQTIADRAVSGTENWYAERVLEFQYGDDLSFVNDVPTYPVIDATKQIVKRVAVTEQNDGIVLIKAKKAGSVVLTTPEQTALTIYVKQIKFAGTKTQVLSIASDLLKLGLTVYFNGLFDPAVIQINVEAAINNYLANIPFNGVFSIYDLTLAIKPAVAGVIDVVVNSAQAKSGSNPYTDVGREYPTVSGDMIIDPANPLSATVSYLISNV